MDVVDVELANEADGIACGKPAVDLDHQPNLRTPARCNLCDDTRAVPSLRGTETLQARRKRIDFHRAVAGSTTPAGGGGEVRRLPAAAVPAIGVGKEFRLCLAADQAIDGLA